MSEYPNTKEWSAWELGDELKNAEAMGYAVLLCADCTYGGTNWTRRFAVEIDHERKVVRLRGVVS